MLRTRVLLIVLLLVSCCSVARAQQEKFEDQVHERVQQALTLGEKGSAQGAYGDIASLADYVVEHAGPRQLSAMAECEGALGMLDMVLASNANNQQELLGLFRDHPAFMIELGLLCKQEDNAQGVVSLARTLMKTRAEQVDRYPALAAAVCVVHDNQGGRELTRHINENEVEASDPVAIFDFFVNNANNMYISPNALPGIALVYVVDVTESPEQLEWANQRFRANPAIKDRFFEIQYDTLHFQNNQPKRVTAQPGEYNLQKINQYGGVCADQAYYAMSVAQACGVPAVYIVARGADVGHAWVGFVEKQGRRLNWNFDAGRYPEYQNLRGNLTDPQTLDEISDGRIGITDSAMNARTGQVLVSLAAAHAVERMGQGKLSPAKDLNLNARGNTRSARTGSVDDRLTLLRLTLKDCPGVPRAWDRVIELADAGELDEKQMDVWSRAVIQLAGRTRPDFAYDFLMDLITTVKDPDRQHEMLEWAFGQFRSRPDLAAGVRFQQGELWASNDNMEYAWLAYKDVVDKFINDGPMVIRALHGMESLLEGTGKQDQIIPYLEDAVKRVKQPGNMSAQFAQQSNYYKINSMLADAYEQAGRTGDAQRVRQRLGN